MRSTASTTLLLAIVTTMSAKCYKSGDAGNTVTVYPGGSRTACVSKDGKNSYYFLELHNTGGDIQFLDIPYGKKRLADEIGACDLGGESDADNWFARIRRSEAMLLLNSTDHTNPYTMRLDDVVFGPGRGMRKPFLASRCQPGTRNDTLSQRRESSFTLFPRIFPPFEV
ncbi:hypothetical protein K458DRAFT_405593 [Lentithecium fluviatile CBS 122367]|uniref:Lytic polysaccharide monooxygenase n=1 Tax=Lentithecium fluviatile CBS 122367 TaxID=1168545 RepID=A0A6G1IX83_9PLEO|nr:hypothetical protein K458DRAFT_405593 [Lentithecium fluviatile CBS 122367]